MVHSFLSDVLIFPRPLSTHCKGSSTAWYMDSTNSLPLVVNQQMKTRSLSLKSVQHCPQQRLMKMMKAALSLGLQCLAHLMITVVLRSCLLLRLQGLLSQFASQGNTEDYSQGIDKESSMPVDRPAIFTTQQT